MMFRSIWEGKGGPSPEHAWDLKPQFWDLKPDPGAPGPGKGQIWDCFLDRFGIFVVYRFDRLLLLLGSFGDPFVIVSGLLRGRFGIVSV